MIYFANELNLSHSLTAIAVMLCSLLASADSLDEGVLQDSFLQELSAALGSYDIDVSSNLNSRAVVRQKIRRPRLGRFPDLPMDSLASSEEILNWETAYSDSQIGGIAILIDTDAVEAPDTFTERWLNSSSDRRVIVTFIADDLSAAENVASVANAYGHSIELVFGSDSAAHAGELYATAAQRLALDSQGARKLRTDVTELEYLGERVRRRSNSLFSDDGNRGNRALARREPPVFLKESLGDEFNQSTIEEIVVPGGVALGEVARLDFVPAELRFLNGELQLFDEAGVPWTLPALELPKQKALFDFVARSEAIGSDSIVDLDADGRVKISSALRDTDVGYGIMHADTQPFEFVPNLPVTKSVIIDIAADWRQVAPNEPLQFRADFEVRFLSADNMRIAQTRAALEYEYESVEEIPTYLDSWGRYVNRLDENLDYSGLGESMAEVASYAGWAGLFRRIVEDEVRFLHGRYDFMKIDKTGRQTPGRY